MRSIKTRDGVAAEDEDGEGEVVGDEERSREVHRRKCWPEEAKSDCEW